LLENGFTVTPSATAAALGTELFARQGHDQEDSKG
jgi:hypothetical protein